MGPEPSGIDEVRENSRFEGCLETESVRLGVGLREEVDIKGTKLLSGYGKLP